MKKLITLTKTLLVLAGLCVGVNAWGQISSWTYNATGEYTGGQTIDGSASGVATITLGNGTWSVSTGSYPGIWTNSAGATTFTDNIPTSGTYLKIQPTKDIKLLITTGSNNNYTTHLIEESNPTVNLGYSRPRYKATNTFDNLKAGKTYYFYGDGYKTSGDNLRIIDYTATSYESYTIHYVDDSPTPVTIKEDVVYSGLFGTKVTASDFDMAQIVYNDKSYAYSSGNTTITLGTETNEITLVYTTVAATTYTIRYVDSDGNTIANDAVIESYVGEEVSATGNYIPTYISYNDKKYKYSSGNTVLTVTSSEEDNIITLVYEEAPKYSYTVKSSTGKIIQTGSEYENEKVTYYWYAALNVGGVLYTAPAINSQYKSEFTLDSDDKEIVVNYTASSTITNLIYLAEGEKVFTQGSGSNADIRCSMGLGGYASSATPFATLPAGSYTLVVYNRCNTDLSDVHVFTAGTGEDAVTILSASGNGYNAERKSEVFTLAETTTLYMTGGNNKCLVDYLYIYGTPNEDVVIGELDFSTGYMGSHKDMTIKQGQIMKIAFMNHGSGEENYFNWLVGLSGTADVNQTLRADNYVIDGASTTTCSITEDGGTINWDDFRKDMQNSLVDMTITYTTEGMFSITATSTGADHTYVHDFAYNNAKSGDILIQLGVERAWIAVLSVGTFVSQSVSAAGYATLCPTYNLNFENATSIEARTAKVDAATGAITYSKVNTVAAGEGVVLASLTGEAVEEDIPVIASATANENNDLVGIPEKVKLEQTSGDYTNYVLAIVNDEIGFYKVNTNGTWCKAGSAYLKVATSTPTARGFFPMWDDATGINDVKNLKSELNGEVYNLNGQRVNNPTKGLYIVNGKKVVLN